MASQTCWDIAQREEVVEEMNRILADPVFKNSRRCVTLFRRLVEQVLSGDEHIKERTLGIEVFGRDADYDTSLDPVVRMTANEIRKRLAQYYQEPDGHHAVKIRMVRGSYLPEFEFDCQSKLIDATAVEISEPSQLLMPVATPVFQIERLRKTETIARRKWILWAIGVTLVAFITVGWFPLHSFLLERSAQYRMWEPLLNSKVPLLLCITDADDLMDANDDRRTKAIANVIETRQMPPVEEFGDVGPVLPFGDAVAANDITLWLASRGKRDSLLRSSLVSIHDLRQGPAVLIGGFENPWSMVLLSNLRYTLRIDPATHDEWIGDAQNPSKHEWTFDGSNKYLGSYTDYGIVSRFQDVDTGNWILGINGLGLHGTKAAIEVITDSALAKSLPNDLPSKQNIQIVVKAVITNGKIGPPQIVTVYKW